MPRIPKISDADAIALKKEYHTKLFYAGEKTIWCMNKAELHNVSFAYITDIVHGYRRKYLPNVEDEET